MSTQPWGDSTVDSWLFDILCTCVDPDRAETVKPDVKQILFSNQESDALQFPLFELLGDSSFDVIETLLNYREMIKEAYTAKPSTTKKSETVQPKPKKIIPLARRSRYEHTDSINMTRYDVEAPDLKLIMFQFQVFQPGLNLVFHHAKPSTIFNQLFLIKLLIVTKTCL